MVAVLGTLVGVLALAVAVLSENQGCLDIPTETSVTPESLEGIWYPVEIVIHRNDSKIFGVPVKTKCPQVMFEVKRKTIEMTWNSSDGELVYKFTQKAGPKQGQWTAQADQTGTLVNDQYKQFHGLVRVLRLDEDFLFLTYCSKTHIVLNTVGFSRTDSMPTEVMEETIGTLDALHFKRAQEIHPWPCEDDDGEGPRALPGALLILATGLLVRLTH